MALVISGMPTTSRSEAIFHDGYEEAQVVPLYSAATLLEPDITVDRGDALVTRFSDRGRDRHAREDQFQSYDHYLPFYFENRVAGIEIVDYVARGGDQIDIFFEPKIRLEALEFRCFYYGANTVAEYLSNGGLVLEPQVGRPNLYRKTISGNWRENRPLIIGDKIECEPSQFLSPAMLPRGRANYYGTAFLYIVGEGLVPWDTAERFYSPAPAPFTDEDAFVIPNSARLGGKTTLHAGKSDEPHNHFMQMATNIGYFNGDVFVLGRRLHHTSFDDGSHDEGGNPPFNAMAGLAGPRYVNTKCSACHVRNGRSAPAAIGEPLSKWVFKVGNASGGPDPEFGLVLQPSVDPNSPGVSEGSASIASWTENNGLRKPVYQFSGRQPARFSGRVAPSLVGIGLLEAIRESTILALEDPDDADGDGISGRASIVPDPSTGAPRLGRFGWKAATISVAHQVASALNFDIGVMTELLPAPDCGAAQLDCGPTGAELPESEFERLVKYNQLLGVRPQRDYDDPVVAQGETVFRNAGCNACHVESVQTGPHHPLGELRSQTIRPYTDLLLHDMGDGLADTLGEGSASGSEWRTAPLWGLGLSPCVTGGVQQVAGRKVCAEAQSYLHDGRARTLDEAIRWHAGEAEASKQAYESLSPADKAAMIRFLESL